MWPLRHSKGTEGSDSRVSDSFVSDIYMNLYLSYGGPG
jgi:hypothetical protein